MTFLENYNMRLGALLTQGCDAWLNNPRPPMEASGTSGMKAAHNGVPHISTIDGWWPEAEGGGWTIPGTGSDAQDGHLLTKLIGELIVPTYSDAHAWGEMMRSSIRNAAFFNTNRMLEEYIQRLYVPQEVREESDARGFFGVAS